MIRLGIVDKKSNKLVPAAKKMKEINLDDKIIDSFLSNANSNEFIETFKSHDKYLQE